MARQRKRVDCERARAKKPTDFAPKGEYLFPLYERVYVLQNDVKTFFKSEDMVFCLNTQ